MDLAVSIMLVVYGGRLLARAMRRRGLHWTFALAALAFVLLLRTWLGGRAAPLALVACVAAARGRRLQRDDLAAGGELARIAGRRLMPLRWVRTSVGRVGVSLWWLIRPASSSGSGILRNRPIGGELLSLGRDEAGAEVGVALGGRSPPLHALILGATGSGKTVTQALLTDGAIRRGMAAVVIDPKGDGALRGVARDAAAATGRPLFEWTPRGPCSYNPYARGGETEIADRVLAAERFTEPHYLRQAQRYLGHAVRVLRARGAEVSLAGIARAMEPEWLESQAHELPDGAEREVALAYLDSLGARQRAELGGVRDRLAILAESDVARWLGAGAGCSGDAAPTALAARDGVRGCPRGHLELRGALEAGAVVYFSLEADSRPLLAQMLGAAIVQDLQSAVSGLQGEPLPTVVAIDEFAALAAAGVAGLFGRARSAGFSLLLATQELADLRLAGREQLLEQVLGNLALLVAHRQVLPASATLLALLAGQREHWRTTRYSDGRASRVRALEPVLAADRLAALRTGEAAVFELRDGRGARIVRIEAGRVVASV
ncbi:MAG TPA: DUF87 domain-containing protein [Solirubrobacteraceae bacterium]